jgi:ABC-type nitrate/sulfonate/bicarbonate transport system substrate-binding protein
MNPNEDVKFLQIGGGESGRLSALKAGVIQGTMLFPPLDLLGKNEGLKVLTKFDVPTPGGGINATTAYVKQNRNLVVNFLKGYMEGIHYMLRRKDESLKVLYKYFQNSDTAAMSYLTKPPAAWKRTCAPMRNPSVFTMRWRRSMTRGPRSSLQKNFGIRVSSKRFVALAL